MIVASTVAHTAMIRLLVDASIKLRSAKAARYQFSENPSHTVNFDELKLKTASINNGTWRNAYIAIAYHANPRFTVVPRRDAAPRTTESWRPPSVRSRLPRRT